MRIAVTGSGGRLGRALLAALANVPLARPAGPFGWDLPEYDLDTPGSAAGLIERDRPEIIVHTAAWTDVEGWDPDTNPIPVTIPQLQNLTFGTFFSGSPYLGAVDDLPVGAQALNQCGEYYHISHNHQLQKITAWGIVLSGHITFARIDPPLPNTCP